MTATSHALTGAVVALVIKQPVLAVPLAFISHFICDMIPHFDLSRANPGLARYTTALDILIAGILSVLLPLTLTQTVPGWLIFACMIAAVIPDSVWGWRYYKFRDFSKVITAKPIAAFTRLHLKIQWSESPIGIIPESFWDGLMIILIIKL